MNFHLKREYFVWSEVRLTHVFRSPPQREDDPEGAEAEAPAGGPGAGGQRRAGVGEPAAVRLLRVAEQVPAQPGAARAQPAPLRSDCQHSAADEPGGVSGAPRGHGGARAASSRRAPPQGAGVLSTYSLCSGQS